jgi:hypothetical protein
MNNLRNYHWPLALCLILLAVSGCAGGQKPCNDTAPGAIPQPNGTYACRWIHAQTTLANRDNFAIYQYEWSADAAKLSTFGQEHVAQIAQCLPQVPFPVVIEASTDPHLNELRRMAVLEALANYHVPIVPERVVLGRPEAEGLYGQEAPGVAGAMLGAQGGGAGATSGGAMGGGAAGATGGGIY